MGMSVKEIDVKKMSVKELRRKAIEIMKEKGHDIKPSQITAAQARQLIREYNAFYAK